MRSPAEGKVIPQIRLTETDNAILQQVYRHRLLSSDAIYRLFPDRSQQQLSRRLHALFLNKYLGRPRRQVELFPLGAGSAPLVYCLDCEGAKHLREQLGIVVQSYHCLKGSSELSRRSLAHFVLVSDFMTDLSVSMRKSGRAKIVYFDEIVRDLPELGSESRQFLKQPCVEVEWNGYRGQEGTRPDFIFGIEYLDCPNDENRSLFYLEIDDGIESIESCFNPGEERNFFRKSSVLRKIVVYGHLHRFHAEQQHLRAPSVSNVLFVTRSVGRANAIQAAFARHCLGRHFTFPPELFLFKTRLNDNDTVEDLFSGSWFDALGNRRSISGQELDQHMQPPEQTCLQSPLRQ